MQNLLNDYRCEMDQDAIFRTMGYPDSDRVSEPVREVCREQVRRVRELAEPWGTRCQIGIEDAGADSVRLVGGGTLKSRRVAGILHRATLLEACLVTLGPAISAEIRRLTAGSCMIEALALDAAATVVTNDLMGQLRQRICVEAGERSCGTTIPYGPGYTGWEIQDLPVLFSRFAVDQPPVRLNEALMMIPEKSLLCVIGIVPGGQPTRREVVPCRLCDLHHCSLRRVPHRPGADD